MRALRSWLVVAGFVVAACSGNGGSSAMSSGNPLAPTSPASASLTGTWTGSTGDSSGSMMGAGLTRAMMQGATWQLSQTGDSFTGVMQFQGYAGGRMTVSGTLSGSTGTFTMTIPVGAMMGMGQCMATATGSFDWDEAMSQIHGIYAGSNTCDGPFNDGQLTLTRQ